MPLPDATEEALRGALAQFDQNLRDTADWQGWTSNRAHKFAIVEYERLYPVKQIISMATGVPVSEFSGGGEANSFVQRRGLKVELLHLPSENEARIALHELLIERHPDPVTTDQAYDVIAERLQIPDRLRKQQMQDGRNHWENRVQFARRRLVDDGILDGSQPRIWRLIVRSQPSVWIEKTLVEGRPDRVDGEYALGKALWSPRRNRGGGDEYATMRLVQPGDVVLHLTDSAAISGVSIVASYVSTNFQGLAGTDWEGMDGYMVRLEGYIQLNPPLRRQNFLGDPQWGTQLRSIRSNHRNLFYDRDLNLNQGAYLTAAPTELASLLNQAYRSISEHALPHFERLGLSSAIDPEINVISTSAPQPKEREPRVWLYAPGRGAEHWEEFYRDGIMAIGWDEVGDLSGLSTLEEAKSHLMEVYDREGRPINDAKACFDFAHEIQPGDLVFAKQGRQRIVGYGTVLGDYVYDASREGYKNVRRVRWDGRGSWPVDTSLIMKTLTDITSYTDLVDSLKRLVSLTSSQEDLVAPADERIPYGIDEALSELFVPRAEFEAILRIWRTKKNLILQGPPGVGKTFVAKRLAYALMKFKDPSRVGMVQFHQSYSYEDFVLGYRPSEGGLKLKKGLFLEFCRRAARDPDTPHVFIIDEINRGNLSRIFGELLMLIESDKRGSAWSMPLTYSENSEDQFFVPDNLYLLGLMNTADRSLAMVDYALRRRFAFWDVSPQIGAPKFAEMLLKKGVSQPAVTALVSILSELNDEISSDSSNLGPGYCIGHSYFCSPVAEDAEPDQWIKDVIETEVLPLVREYWIDDPAKSARWSNELRREFK